MRFRIEGWFEADDLEDAWERLGRHFTMLANDGDTDPSVFTKGEMAMRVARADNPRWEDDPLAAPLPRA